MEESCEKRLRVHGCVLTIFCVDFGRPFDGSRSWKCETHRNQNTDRLECVWLKGIGLEGQWCDLLLESLSELLPLALVAPFGFGTPHPFVSRSLRP